jgi:hypothetical protein
VPAIPDAKDWADAKSALAEDRLDLRQLRGRQRRLLEQGGLVSPEASATMRDIFASPGIAHDLLKPQSM